MKRELAEATQLVVKLEEMTKQAGVRSGDEVIIDQMAVFGKLLVVLTRYMDKAQNTIKWLTWVLTAMTAVLVGEVLLRIFHHQ